MMNEWRNERMNGTLDHIFEYVGQTVQTKPSWGWWDESDDTAL